MIDPNEKDYLDIEHDDISNVDAKHLLSIQCSGCDTWHFNVENKSEIGSCPNCFDLVCTYCGKGIPPQRNKGDACDFQGWNSHDMEYVPCYGKYDIKYERRRLVSIKRQWGGYGMPPKDHPLWNIR
jgi:hypothetical protein